MDHNPAMPIPPQDIREDCRVAGPEVRLTVTIGDGQTGVVSVYVDGILITRAAGGVGQLLLGTSATLTGHVLHVRTIVTDVMSLTNRMSVSYVLSGLSAPCITSHEGIVDNDGDQLTFKAYFQFVR
jgi:hypothetical protein